VPNPQLDVFETDPGVDAGRIESTEVVPLDGAWVYCLGHDRPGYMGFLQPGDNVKISQTGTLPAGNVFRFQAVTRAAANIPAGYSWFAQVLLDGVVVGNRSGPVFIPRTETILTSWEWFVDVTGLVGSHTIAFRLLFNGPALPGPPGLPVLEAEIPAFFVDDLVFSTVATAPMITNPAPTANQGIDLTVGPPALTTASVNFDLFGLGSNVDSSTIDVDLNGVHAVIGGLVQSGFNGTVDPSGEVVHVRVSPNLGFTSAETVLVAVTASTVAPTSNSRSWSFKVVDTTPPTMTSIQALGTKQLRITWSKNVTLVDPTNPHDGLNPALYYVQAVQPNDTTPVVSGGPEGPLVYTPAPYLVVESVSIVSDASPCIVDIFTSDELTAGIVYNVTELGVEDLFGNFETSVTATTSFSPPVPTGRIFNLYRLMPLMNRQEDATQDLLKFLNCMQEPTSLLLHDIDTWTDIFDFNTAPDAFLTAILADLGNPFPFVLSTESKRQLIAILVAIYEQKGTAIGIINAIRFFLGLTVTIGTYDSSGNWILGESFLGEDPVSFPAGNNATITRIGLTTQYNVTGLHDIVPGFTDTTIQFEGAALSAYNSTFSIVAVTGPSSLVINIPSTPGVDGHNGFISWQVTSDDEIFLGTAVLGPGGSFALYAFTVVSGIPLTVAQIQQIEFIANYMKPAHTHLLGVVVPSTPSVYDPVELGISELGEDWILHL